MLNKSALAAAVTTTKSITSYNIPLIGKQVSSPNYYVVCYKIFA